MKRHVLEVELGGHGSLVRGHGSRELIIAITGRAPVWVSRLRGWSVQESTARDVVAAAELQGYDVVIIGAQKARKARLFEVLTAAPALEDLGVGRRDGGLW